MGKGRANTRKKRAVEKRAAEELRDAQLADPSPTAQSPAVEPTPPPEPRAELPLPACTGDLPSWPI